MQAQLSFPKNRAVSPVLLSSWIPIFECPVSSIRLKQCRHQREITLSLICSALPKKSARHSVTRPVTKRDVKSNIPFGSSSESARLSESHKQIATELTTKLILLLCFQRSYPFWSKFSSTAESIGAKPYCTHFLYHSRNIPH